MTNIGEIRRMTPSLHAPHNHGAIIKVLESKVHHLIGILAQHGAITDPAVPRAVAADLMGATANSFDDLIQWATTQKEFSQTLRDRLEFEAAVAAEVERQTR